MGGLCSARMSDAGLSFETATRRGSLGRGSFEEADWMRDVTEARFARSVVVRDGEAGMMTG